jgi:hypothetical protein
MGVTDQSMLLLDLDGVVVFEAEPPLAGATELILLHEDLDSALAGLGIPVVVLTHRSRREARRIIQAAGLDAAPLAGVIAAEDLVMAGFRHAPMRMFKHGLRKDLALSVLEHRFGVDRSRIAFIDDRIDNLRDLLAAGLGLAIHAPSYLTVDRQFLMTFNISDALASIQSWDRSARQSTIVSLSPRPLATSLWCRTGVSTRPYRRHVFNVARRMGNFMRLVFLERLL